tara:strand:+ start:1092 stop:1646 length:555 start_codon:yes stop_codon:yes gene_type:complete
MSREIRNLVNSSNQEASLEVGVGRVLPEGGSSVNLEEGRLVIKRKYNNLIYKSFMSRDGNEIVDKNLDVIGRIKSRITLKDLIFDKGPDLEISSDAITVTHSFHDVDVSGGSASTDDLESINGGTNGQILILQAKHGSRTIVIKNAVDNIHVKGGSDFSLDSSNDVAVCIKLGGDWYVIIAESF